MFMIIDINGNGLYKLVTVIIHLINLYTDCHSELVELLRSMINI